MNAKDIITAMFFEGWITFEHHWTCDGEEKYCVCSEDGSILFICTKEWWDNAHDTHHAVLSKTFECGCKVEVLNPNGNLHLAADAIGISLN